MLPGLFILLACQLLGEAMVHATGVPVPGPVAGIVLVLLFMAMRHALTNAHPAGHDAPLGLAADGLLRHLGLLFVPAGVGIVGSAGSLLAHGVGVLAALMGSTVLTLVVTVAVFRLVSRAVGTRTA